MSIISRRYSTKRREDICQRLNVMGWRIRGSRIPRILWFVSVDVRTSISASCSVSLLAWACTLLFYGLVTLLVNTLIGGMNPLLVSLRTAQWTESWWKLENPSSVALITDIITSHLPMLFSIIHSSEVLIRKAMTVQIYIQPSILDFNI